MSRTTRFPIWVVLAVTFGGLAAVSIAVVAAAINFYAIRNTNQLVNNIADREITTLEETLNAELNPALEQVIFLSRYMAQGQVQPDDNKRLSDLLMGSLAASPQLNAVTFIRPDLQAVIAARQVNGKLYVTDVASGLYNAGLRLALRAGSVATQPIWGEAIYLPELEKPVMTALAPVRRNGVVAGVFTAVVSLPDISHQLDVQFGQNQSTPFVLGTGGAVFAHRQLLYGDFHLSTDHPLPQFNAIGDAVLARFDEAKSITVQPQRMGSTTFQQQKVSIKGEDHFIIFKRVTNLVDEPLIIGIHLKTSLVSEVYAALWTALYWSGVVIAIAVMTALALGRFIGFPVSELADATSRLVALDFGNAPTLKGSRFREIDIAANAYNSMRNGLGWFSTYVPQTLVPHLMSPSGSELLASREVEVTVLFTDIVGFSGIAQRLSPRRLAAFLNRHFGLLGGHIAAEGGSIDKYIGDSIMAFWGAPEAQEDHALRAVRAAQRIAARLGADNARRAKKGLAPVRIRIGIHSGRAIAGNIGAPGRINYTLVGDTVNIAQRLEQFGKKVDDGKRSAIVCLSADAANLLPDGIELTALGKEILPGRNTETEIYQLD